MSAFPWMGNPWHFKSGSGSGPPSEPIPNIPIIVPPGGFPNDPGTAGLAPLNPGERDTCVWWNSQTYYCELDNGDIIWQHYDRNNPQNNRWWRLPAAQVPPHLRGALRRPRLPKRPPQLILPVIIDPDAAEVGVIDPRRRDPTFMPTPTPPVVVPRSHIKPPGATAVTPPTRTPPNVRPPRGDRGEWAGVGNGVLGAIAAGGLGAAIGTACEQVATLCGNVIEDFYQDARQLMARLERMDGTLRDFMLRLRLARVTCPMSKQCRDWLADALKRLRGALDRIEQLMADIGEIDRLIADLDVEGLSLCFEFEILNCARIESRIVALRNGVRDADNTVSLWATAMAGFDKACACPNPLQPVRPIYTAA